MVKEFNILMRKQLQERLRNQASFADESVPKGGWIRTIRGALGMPIRILAKKIGCSPSNITAMEQREAKGTISLDTLQQVAQAMGCKLFYGFVPIESLDKILEDQATLLARKRIDMINHSMKLEQQGLTKSQLQQQEEALVQELLQGDPKALWKDI